MAYVIQLQDGSTHTIFDVYGLKDLVDPEIYKLVEHFSTVASDKMQHEIKCLEQDIKGYDVDLYSLREAAHECVESLEEVIEYISNCKRINRDNIYENCIQSINCLRNSEGY